MVFFVQTVLADETKHGAWGAGKKAGSPQPQWLSGSEHFVFHERVTEIETKIRHRFVAIVHKNDTPWNIFLIKVSFIPPCKGVTETVLGNCRFFGVQKHELILISDYLNFWDTNRSCTKQQIVTTQHQRCGILVARGKRSAAPGSRANHNHRP